MSEVRPTSNLQELSLDELSVRLFRYLRTDVGVLKIDAHDLDWSVLSDEISEAERALFFQILGSLKFGLEVMKDTTRTANTLPIKNFKLWQSIYTQFQSLQAIHLENSEVEVNTNLAAENSLALFNKIREHTSRVNHIELYRFSVLDQLSSHLLALQSFFSSVLEDQEKSRTISKLEKQVKEVALSCLHGTLKSSYLRSSKLNWLSMSKNFRKDLLKGA